MNIEYNINGINIFFEVADDGKLNLLNFSKNKYTEDLFNEYTKYWCTPFEIHIAGGNQDQHHGAKHTATSGFASMKYKSHKLFDNEYGKKLEIVVCDDKLEAVLNYQFYTGISGVRSWVSVKNICKEKVGLEYVTSISLPAIDVYGKKSASEKMRVYIPYSPTCRELNWREYSFSDLGIGELSATNRVCISNTGTWSAKEFLPMGAVSNTEVEETLLWQIENNNSWMWEIGGSTNYKGEFSYLKLSGPTERENHWYKELDSGEAFETVTAAVMFGTDFDSALEEMTRYRRQIVRKNIAEENLPVIFNDYMNYLCADPTTEKELPLIDLAAKAGAEYYVMDAGWYADGTWWETVGEWLPCDWRFPNGIKEVFDYIREKGMIPGLWVEIESVGINCPILDRFDDDCFFVRHGKRVIDHGRYQFDFRSKKVRDFATSVIDRIYNEYGVRYIKNDYNIEAGQGTERNSDSYGDGLLGHGRAYLLWIEEMMNKYPDLIIEGCASGAMRADYATLSLHSIYSVTDCTDYRKMSRIARNAATGFLPEQAAIWTYPKACDDDTATAFNMVNAMFTRVHLSGEIANISNSQFEIIKEGIECYKSIRKDIGDFVAFYPEGVNSYDKDWLCVGYKGNGNTYLGVWKLHSDEEEHFFPFANDKDCATILYPSANNASCEVSPDGIKVGLPEKYSAIVIKLD